MLAIIAALLGIAGTFIGWRFNPNRPKLVIYAELDSIYHQLEKVNAQRDWALEHNDSDMLTVTKSEFTRLCQRKAILLQRLRKVS